MIKYFAQSLTFFLGSTFFIVITLLFAAELPIKAKLQEDVAIQTHISTPSKLPVPEITKLKIPDNFEITKLAEGMGNARILAVSTDGKIYVTRREEGDIKMLSVDQNGRPNGKPITVASRSGLHGLDFHAGKAYMVTASEVFVADVKPDGTFGPLNMIIHDLPAAGQHNNRTIQVGPDAMLYITVGSTCNICNESSPENGTILRASLDGKKRAIFASGLRNTIGFDWHPVTGELWGMDHGIDWHGEDVMPEELNLIAKGQRFGWPYLYGNNQIVPRIEPAGKLDKEEWKINSVPMTLGYTSHAAPMQMAFYGHSQFPAEYRGDAFVAMHGSWNRKQPSGYEIVHVDYQEGKPMVIKPFVTGFLEAQSSSGRPVGLAVAKDGSLLFSDDQNGTIYRLAYKGKDKNAKSATSLLTAPATAMNAQAAKGSGVPIAINRPETAIEANTQAKPHSSITVTTPAFQHNGVIPDIYSGYAQDANFRIDWSKAPSNTQSYVLIMEDPDAKNPIPFIHWLVWNIPAEVTSLQEGLKKQDRLLAPEGIRQGPTSTGKIGYIGPKPPKGDSEHHYHVQIFALDSVLNLPAGSDRDQLLQAMQGHVITKGELVGKFKRPSIPVKP